MEQGLSAETKRPKPSDVVDKFIKCASKKGQELRQEPEQYVDWANNYLKTITCPNPQTIIDCYIRQLIISVAEADEQINQFKKSFNGVNRCEYRRAVAGFIEARREFSHFIRLNRTVARGIHTQNNLKKKGGRNGNY